MKTTRQRLMDHLQAKQVATAEELSHVLHVTSANIRHHLSVLESEGVVEVIGKRTSGGRGRPVNLYGLSQQMSLNNLDGLASAILRVMAQPSLAPEPAPQLRRIAAEMAKPPDASAPGLSQRLVQAVKQLNEMHYQARWEAHADAPRLILNRCPYASILPEHPELCRMDAMLLEEMLGFEARQTARLERNPQGLPQCIFVLDKNKPSPS